MRRTGSPPDRTSNIEPGRAPASRTPRDRTPRQRADLAEALVPYAAELAVMVREDGPDTIHAHLAKVPGGDLTALAIVLAAMVDIDQSLPELLSWITWTWDGTEEPADQPDPTSTQPSSARGRGGTGLPTAA